MNHPGDTPSARIAQGPAVARWRCPCCGESVPRLLPNGHPNRQALASGDCILTEPAVESAASADGASFPLEVCLSCHDAVRGLVGTLIRPPGEEGDARDGPGLNDTGIVGAVLPRAGDQAQVLIFHVVDGRLALTERERFTDLDAARLTYPGRRGAVAPLLWRLYERHLATLHTAEG